MAWVHDFEKRDFGRIIMPVMDRKYTIRAGRLRVDFRVPQELSAIFLKAAKNYEVERFYPQEIVYNLTFEGVPERESYGKPVKSSQIRQLCNYFKDLFGRPKRFAKGVTLPRTILSFMNSEKVLTLINGNMKRLRKDFFLYELAGKFLVAIDLRSRHGSIFYQTYMGRGVDLKSFNYCVNFLLFYLVAAADSFVLHCSSVKVGKRGMLFVGKGGGGKSTLASIILNNIKGSRFVSDDLAVITYDVRNGNYYASRFRKDSKKLKVKNVQNRRVDKFRISEVYLIEKSKTAKILDSEKLMSLALFLNEHIVNNSNLFNYKEKMPYAILDFINKHKPSRLLFPKNADCLDALGIKR